MTSSRFTLSLLLLIGGSMLAAGCVPLGTQTRRDDRRYPDTRRTTTRGEAAIYSRVSNDANRYVRSIDRSLRLDRRQEQRITRLLADRAYDQTRRSRGNQAYPFPRRAADRSTEKWWHDADKRIERELSRQQKRVYKDMTRQYERSARRDDGKKGRHDNGRRRRGGGN